jgi:tRNA threonylcarbamoyladenosine biosynthesis protein TsaB
MIILACETSTLLGSVAILKDGKLLSSKQSMRQGSHSEVLNIFIQQALDEASIQLSDVDLFASGIGPGSFTGIRISLNMIKTFSFCFNKPCVGMNSLQSLAFNCAQKQTHDRPIVALINAYKNMVYAATYKKSNAGLVEIKKPSVVRVQNLAQYVTEESDTIGDGFLAYEKYFTPELKNLLLRSSTYLDEPTAQNIAEWAFQSVSTTTHWSELIPIYLRSSEAEENAQGIKYEPLF